MKLPRHSDYCNECGTQVLSVQVGEPACWDSATCYLCETCLKDALVCLRMIAAREANHVQK